MTNNASETTDFETIDVQTYLSKSAVELEVSVTLNVGVRTITFAKRKTVFVATISDQVREYDMLTEQLEYQIEHWSKEYLPKIKQVEAPGSSANGAVTYTSYRAKALIRENKEGKYRYKIQTISGKYMHYGCNVWDEQVREYGLADLMGAADYLELIGVTIQCEDRDRGGAVRQIIGLP